MKQKTKPKLTRKLLKKEKNALFLGGTVKPQLYGSMQEKK